MAVIDSLEFAQTGQTLSGKLQISQMLRLMDSLLDGAGEMEFRVTGGRDARRRPVLVLEISGVLHLQCQRCLGLLEQPLRLSSTLTLASESEVAEGGLDDEDVEWIEAGGSLNVADLVEDEILLSLPYAPRHAEGLCGQVTAAAADAGGKAFAKLAALKRNSN